MVSKLFIFLIPILCLLQSCTQDHAKNETEPQQEKKVSLLDSKWGFIDPEGVFQIKPQYETAENFHILS